MATFSAQITDLVGGTIDDTANDQWAADACKEIIHQLPAKLKAKCSTVSLLNNSATTMDLDAVGDILHVTRLSADSGGFQLNCREIDAIHGGLAEDSSSLSYYATASDPVFWIASNTSDVGTLFVKPDPTANQTSYVYHISYPTVDISSDSTIANFPDEAEYLVVLYAAIKQLQQYMNSKSSDLPSDLTLPVLESVTSTLPTWSAPSDFVAPTVPVLPSFSAQTVDSFGTVPAYTKPTITSRVAFSSYTSGLSETDPGIFSISAVPPSTPSINTIAYSDASNADAAVTDVTATGSLASAPSIIDVSSNAPAYTPPKVTGDTQELTATIVAGAPAATADFLNYMHWFDVLADMIETNEDIEMASVQLNKISTYLQSYQLAMQNQLNEFNEANVRYQMEFQEASAKANQDLQVAISNANNGASEFRQEAQQATEMSKFNKSQDQALNLANAAKTMEKLVQDNSSKLQKFQSEISVYQANVSKEVQQYTTKLQHYSTELNTAYQAWAKTESDTLAEYSTDIQNEINEFNKENVAYQAVIQKNIQEAQLADANEARKLSKYQAEVGAYGAELNTNAQTFANAVAKNRAAFDTSIQNYTSEVSKVSTSNSSILQKFQAETADFSARLQKQTTDYTWYQGQYVQLKTDYAAGIAVLKGG